MSHTEINPSSSVYLEMVWDLSSAARFAIDYMSGLIAFYLKHICIQ